MQFDLSAIRQSLESLVTFVNVIDAFASLDDATAAAVHRLAELRMQEQSAQAQLSAVESQVKAALIEREQLRADIERLCDRSRLYVNRAEEPQAA